MAPVVDEQDLVDQVTQSGSGSVRPGDDPSVAYIVRYLPYVVGLLFGLGFLASGAWPARATAVWRPRPRRLFRRRRLFHSTVPAALLDQRLNDLLALEPLRFETDSPSICRGRRPGARPGGRAARGRAGRAPRGPGPYGFPLLRGCQRRAEPGSRRGRRGGAAQGFEANTDSSVGASTRVCSTRPNGPASSPRRVSQNPRPPLDTCDRLSNSTQSPIG